MKARQAIPTLIWGPATMLGKSKVHPLAKVGSWVITWLPESMWLYILVYIMTACSQVLICSGSTPFQNVILHDVCCSRWKLNNFIKDPLMKLIEKHVGIYKNQLNLFTLHLFPFILHAYWYGHLFHVYWSDLDQCMTKPKEDLSETVKISPLA